MKCGREPQRHNKQQASSKQQTTSKQARQGDKRIEAAGDTQSSLVPIYLHLQALTQYYNKQ